MELTWYGNATLVVRSGEAAIAFDPFCGVKVGELKRPPAVLPCQEALGRVRWVLVTHGHFDHIYHIPRLYGDTDTTVYCTAAPARTLERRGFDPRRLKVIAPGWTGTAGPFTLRAFQGRHCRFDLPLILRTLFRGRLWRHPGHLARLLSAIRAFPEKGETLLYEVEERGFRLQVMGSMGLDPAADYPTGADLLVLPLQGRSDQDTYVLELVKRLAPKAVLLDHINDAFPPISDDVDPSGALRNLRAMGIPCRTPEPGVPIILNPVCADRLQKSAS